MRTVDLASYYWPLPLSDRDPIYDDEGVLC